MEIVEATHGRGGVGGVDDGDGHLGKIGHFEVAGKENGGNDARGHQKSLADLQGHGRGENGVDGQEGVVDGRNMHHKMGE